MSARLTSGPGRRLVLAVGGLIVLAAGLIAVIVIGGRGPTAISIASSAASPSPPSTGASSPPAATATPSGAPSAPQFASPFAARVLVDGLRVRQTPGTSGKLVSSFATGDIVFLQEHRTVDGSEWYFVNGKKGVYGWVAQGTAKRPYLQLLRKVATAPTPAIWGLAEGGHGYIAWGGDFFAGTSALYASADGATWSRAQLPSGVSLGLASATWGPKGWILVTASPTRGAIQAVLHADASATTWSALPTRGIPTAMSPDRLVATSAGYLLGASLFSADGVAWARVANPPQGPNYGDVASIGNTFLTWASGSNGGIDVRVSEDPARRGWTAVRSIETSVSLNGQPKLAGSRTNVVLLAQDPTSGQLMIWTAPRQSLTGPQRLTWTRQLAAEKRFAGASVVSLDSNGNRVVAIGYRKDEGAPRAWVTVDGATWQEISVPGLFGGGTPAQAAGGGLGFAASGYAPATAPAAMGLVLWHSTDGVAWSQATQSIWPAPASPVMGGCPPKPSDYISFLAIPSSVALACFGSQEISFKAYLTVGGGCGGTGPGSYTPTWLAQPFTPRLILDPFQAPFGGCGGPVLAPGLKVPSELRWVQVTGHFGDPASATCRYTPDPIFPVPGHPQAVINQCLQQFVATNVVVAP